jgi:serine/threonine protein kinase
MTRIVLEDDSPPIPEGLSDSLVAFLNKCLRKAPEGRSSAKELSQHEWLNPHVVGGPSYAKSAKSGEHVFVDATFSECAFVSPVF